jgi:hypothetical protein
VKRFRPPSAAPQLFTALILFLSAGLSCGIDFTPWARHMHQHQDWTSLDFRDPFTGLFLAARAGTEDKRSNATLTLTAMPARGCAADFVVVVKDDAPAVRDSEEFTGIAARIDDLKPQRLGARIVRQEGDPFIFVQILDEVRPDTLKDRQTMAVVLPNARVAIFSLRGFGPAWSIARATCQSFLTP